MEITSLRTEIDKLLNEFEQLQNIDDVVKEICRRCEEICRRSQENETMSLLPASPIYIAAIIVLLLYSQTVNAPGPTDR